MLRPSAILIDCPYTVLWYVHTLWSAMLYVPYSWSIPNPIPLTLPMHWLSFAEVFPKED